MKKKLYVATLSVLVLFGAGALAAENDRVTSITSIEKVRSDLQMLNGELLATGASLQKVKEAEKNPAELKSAIRTFTAQATGLEAQSENIRKNVLSMKVRTKEYHDAWLKELEGMQNPSLKEKASKRFQEVKEEFDKIIETGDEAKRSFVPFVADLKDVKTYLETDPSSDAVKSLSNTIWKLGNRAHGVAGDVKNVIDQIDRTLEKSPGK